MSDKILSRSEIDEKYTWNLSDLFENNAKWESAVSYLSEKIKEISRFRGNIKDGKTLLNVLRLNDQIGELLLRVYAYAKMHRDEDNTNTKYQEMTDRATRVMTDAGVASAFLVPEITGVGENKITAWINDEENLSVYAHYFHNIFREAKHVLSAREEEILTHTSEIGESASEIFDMWNDADLSFEQIEDQNGNKIPVTHGRYANLMQNKNRTVRIAAFNSMYSAYKNWKNTLSAMMSANVKKTCFFAKVRNYESALDMALSEDNIESRVYNNLIKNIGNRSGLLCEYLKLRRTALGLDELHLYDLQVPLIELDEKKYAYEEAQELVLAAVAPLGEEYVSNMRRAFLDRWIDVYENKGKTSGAYSWGSNDVHPYVLLNFQGTLNDVFTLAHEMGHAMHSYYTNKTQPSIYKNYKIFVAEVASTVNENLLMEHLFKTTDDDRIRAYLIGHRLEEFRTTVFRQTMFAEFERETHAAYEEGKSLTADFLCDLYYKLNCKYMGDGAVIDEDIAYEWARVPHFYSDFYVYQYATGYCAAVTLAEGILSDKKKAMKYIEFLSMGDSEYPIELLARAGADLRTDEPTQKAIKQFANDIEEFKRLCK